MVVGALIGGGTAVAFFYLLPLAWFVGCLVLLAYEGFTLVDSQANNTISEAVWVLASRPLVPLLTGIAVGWALHAGYLSVYVSFGLGMLAGHFFWQAQRVYTRG